MILIEAVKSGKKFKIRKFSFGPVYGKLVDTLGTVAFEYEWEGTTCKMQLNTEEILAEDWEVEE